MKTILNNIPINLPFPMNLNNIRLLIEDLNDGTSLKAGKLKISGCVGYKDLTQEYKDIITAKN